MSIAVIGGTGIDEVAGLVAGSAERVGTRLGEAELFRTSIGGVPIVFMPRHGREHSVAPSRINYRAQIAALKKIGVSRIVAVCAVGSLRADLGPGTFAVLGDFLDLTRRRESTFFEEPDGPVVHTDFSVPYCPEVSSALAGACESENHPHIEGAVYVGVDGPRYESPAEIRLFGSWGGDVIGMTGLPEAVLAREAGICYGSLAVVTNAAAGASSAPISHDEVREAMRLAGPKLLAVVSHAVSSIPSARGCACGSNTALCLD